MVDFLASRERCWTSPIFTWQTGHSVSHSSTVPAIQTPSFSAYRQFHMTETTVCIVHNEFVCTIDRGHITVLVMLDLSAASDTDHSVLLEVLSKRFSVGGDALKRLNSYLSDRTQTFCFCASQSDPFKLVCSVPQDSVLGPVEYIAYTEDVVNNPREHGLNNHMYGDDIQLYVQVAVAEVHSALNPAT